MIGTIIGIVIALVVVGGIGYLIYKAIKASKFSNTEKKKDVLGFNGAQDDKSSEIISSSSKPKETVERPGEIKEESEYKKIAKDPKTSEYKDL